MSATPSSEAGVFDLSENPWTMSAVIACSTSMPAAAAQIAGVRRADSRRQVSVVMGAPDEVVDRAPDSGRKPSTSCHRANPICGE
jgi:hypothetical protein